jgi:O-antigen ligase
MAIAGSRYVGQWLNLGAPQAMVAEAYLEGSPVDRAVFMILIVSGIVVLLKRKLDWGSIFKDNAWIWLYFSFGLLSCLWSDYTFVSFKRWFKTLGNVIMVLIVLTEARPYAAFGVIIKRLAFLLLPLSVLFIKYYPELGRIYSWGGQPMFTGVGTQKNSLGQLCLITGIYFAWNLLLSRKADFISGQKLHITIYAIIMPMIVWLLYMASSATSLACLIAAICIFLVAQLPAMTGNPKRMITFGVACVAVFIMLEFAVGIKDTIISLLGRRPDFTDRVDIWDFYLSLVRNSYIGYGFESVYDSIRAKSVANEIYAAHNGYLEMYLNLGVIGLIFVLLWILSGLKKVYNHLLVDYPVAVLKLTLIVVVSLYSWTETTFSGVNNMLFLMFLAIMIAPVKETTIQDKNIEDR